MDERELAAKLLELVIDALPRAEKETGQEYRDRLVHFLNEQREKALWKTHS